jgi:Holliday junction resolvasome RuvABC DNA-binding subunit
MFDFICSNLDLKKIKCPTCLEKVSLNSLTETKSSEENVSDYLDQLGYKESDYKDALQEVKSLQFQVQQIISKIVQKHAKT